MIIEALLNLIGRRKTNSYLTFTSTGALLLPAPDPDHSYLVYLHIPFCETLCPYCSFNRIPFEPGLAQQYFDALQVEMEMYHARGYSFEAVYIGGGTPTILPDRLSEVIEKARTLWPVEQVSIETNPNHLTDPIVETLTRAGINRLSVGVQTFDDTLLKSLGRFDKYGSGEAIMRRLDDYRGVFDTLNIDMIYNFPSQTPENVVNDLATIRDLKVDQVTYYPLMASKMKNDDIVRELGRMDYR